MLSQVLLDSNIPDVEPSAWGTWTTIVYQVCMYSGVCMYEREHIGMISSLIPTGTIPDLQQYHAANPQSLGNERN